jgi:hypothetical protein
MAANKLTYPLIGETAIAFHSHKQFIPGRKKPAGGFVNKFVVQVPGFLFTCNVLMFLGSQCDLPLSKMLGTAQ